MDNKRIERHETMSKAALAGILIGFGVIVNLMVQPPVLGALLFSFGLLTIIDLQLKLYTGMVGFLKPNLDIALLFNLIGIFNTIIIYQLSNPKFYDILSQAAAIKFSKTYTQMFYCGVVCGALIHLAVKSKKTVIVSMAVIIFILVGAEHCIADFPFLIYAFSKTNLLKYILVILGNSIGAIIIERLS